MEKCESDLRKSPSTPTDVCLCEGFCRSATTCAFAKPQEIHARRSILHRRSIAAVTFNARPLPQRRRRFVAAAIDVPPIAGGPQRGGYKHARRFRVGTLPIAAAHGNAVATISRTWR